MKLALLLEMVGFSDEYKRSHITKPRSASLEVVLIPVSIRKKSRMQDIIAALSRVKSKNKNLFQHTHIIKNYILLNNSND